MNILATIQKVERLKRLRDERRQIALARQTPQAQSTDIPLVEWVAKVSRHLGPPHHLAPYARTLDGAPGKGLRIVLAAPPQHGKTVLTSHGLAKMASKARRGSHFAYVTFSQTRADEVARDFRRIASDAGLDPRGPLRQCTLRNRVTIKFTSIGGPLTGYPIDGDGLLVIDDPFKDGREARSKLIRDRVWSWFKEVAMTRVHPGAGVIVMATRWHEDDLSGRLINEGWDYLNLQAICEDPANDPCGRQAGQALWPDKRPAEFLEVQRKRDPWTFAAMYQGQPRPRGGALFNALGRFDKLPLGGYRTAYGIDLAYSAKTLADWSVWVRLRRYGDLYFVTHVCRKQVPAPDFTLALKAAQAEERGPMRWYAAGTEKGSADFIKRKVPALRVLPPKGDKFQRAQPVAEVANLGNLCLPSEESEFWGEWVDELEAELLAFTGVNDANDDQVDALAAGFDELATKSFTSATADEVVDHGTI